MSITYHVARILSLYERAPVRQLLDIDPVGALDWIVVAAGRGIVGFLAPREAVAFLDGPEGSSGWHGNLVFALFWAMLAAAAIALFA